MVAVALNGDGTRAADRDLRTSWYGSADAETARRSRRSVRCRQRSRRWRFRSDAAQFAVAGEDKLIRVLAAGDGKTIKELKGHGDRIASLSFAQQDGNQLFSGSADRSGKALEHQ